MQATFSFGPHNVAILLKIHEHMCMKNATLDSYRLCLYPHLRLFRPFSASPTLPVGKDLGTQGIEQDACQRSELPTDGP